jgi:phosphoribosylformylglycinamidine (FGAM) synthase-like enzyme
MIQLLIFGEATLYSQSDVVITFMYFDSQEKHTDQPVLGSQGLIDKRAVASGHDISDGGIIVALLEMAFAGNCGIHVDLPVLDVHGTVNAKFAGLFTEELGLLLEVS